MHTCTLPPDRYPHCRVKDWYVCFVPYLEFTREEERLINVAKKYCQRAYSSLDLDEDQIQEDEYLDLIEHDTVHESLDFN